jgi:hypothetical protein
MNDLSFNLEDEIGHVATGSESLAEFARNAGMDNPDREWLLDPRDVWVKNPFFSGPAGPHPEDEHFDIDDSDGMTDAEADEQLITPHTFHSEENLPF